MMQGQRQTIAGEFPFPAVTALRGDLILTDIRIAEQDFAIVVRNTIADVKKSYHDYVYIHDAILITQENQSLLEQMLEVASRKFEAGKASYNDVIKARVALSKLSDNLITLEDQETTIIAELNTLMDRPPQALLGRSGYPKLDPPEQTLEELYTLAKISRQEIHRARLREKRIQQMIALAEKMNRPDPTLGASYFEDRSALLVGAEPDRDTFRPAPRQPVRPWFGVRESFIEEMRGREKEMAQRVEEAVNQTLLKVKTAHFSMDAAQRETELYAKTLVPEARQSLEVAETDYEGARVDFLDFLDSQRTWLDFNLALSPLITGTRAIVYVEVPNTEKPTFEGREIVLGPRAGDYYIVKSGLEEGEIVVFNGNFKIDSALQIQAKPSMMSPEGRDNQQKMPAGHQHE